MRIWFTADFHFGHYNVMKYNNRPFNSTKEMNQTIIDNFNTSVKPDDKVYFLGDFAMNVNFVAPHFQQLHGRWVFIRGNHDKPWWNKFLKRTDFLDKKLLEWHDLLETTINKMPITLCHYPMVSWRSSHYGSFMLHGHSHKNYEDKNKMILDVGVDAQNFKPIAWEEIVDIMTIRKKEIKEKKR